MPDEQQRTFRLRTCRESPRNRKDPDSTRTVVVGPVVDPVFGIAARAWRSLAVAGVIVVSAVQNVGVLQRRVAAFDDADDVAGVAGADDLVVGVDVEGQLDVLEDDRRECLLAGGALFQIGVLELRRAEEELEELVLRSHRRRDLVVEPLHGREITVVSSSAAGTLTLASSRPLPLTAFAGRCRRLRGVRGGSFCGRCSTTATAASKAGTDRADGRNCALVESCPRAAAEQPADVHPIEFRAISEPHDSRTLGVQIGVVVVLERREAHAVTGKYDALGDHRLLDAHIARKGNASAVLEGARLAVDLDRNRCAARRPNPLHLDDLEVAAVVASGLDPGLLQPLSDVGGGQPEPFRVGGTALKLVG